MPDEVPGENKPRNPKSRDFFDETPEEKAALDKAAEAGKK